MLGNPVDPSITTVHKGKLVGFCSTMCREKFLKNPAKYEKFLP
jgi:YHS domain-containing protein